MNWEPQFLSKPFNGMTKFLQRGSNGNDIGIAEHG